MAAVQGPRIIGLTGGIASGKSTVAKTLRELGAVIVDADEVARFVVEPGRPAYEKLIAAFGAEILQPANPHAANAAPPIDRERLAARVFADEAARQMLNAITHPEIAKESARRLQAQISGGGVAIYEAPLIVENKLQAGLGGLIVVDVPEEIQFERAVKRGLSPAQAEARMRSQVSRKERLAAANWIIDNRGEEALTRRQTEAVWNDILRGEIPAKKG